MIKMRLSLRIPLTVAIVVVTGIIAFIKISRNTGALPMTPFIIWAVASVILIGITIWSWLGLKGLANENVLFDPPYVWPTCRKKQRTGQRRRTAVHSLTKQIQLTPLSQWKQGIN
jgi:hypothetical protein